VLSVPVGGQFEQVVNAGYVRREGYGMAAGEVTDAVLGEFLERAPEFRRNLSGYHQDGNEKLLGDLEARLQDAVREGPPPLGPPP
jgi:hypothetical protein